MATESIPFGTPFYLKSAEHPEGYICPEGGQAVAEDAGSGLFHLRSEERPEVYLGAEGNANSSALLVWSTREERINFALERAGGHRFYLKSGDYADAYVQVGSSDVQNTSLLVFAP